MKHSLTKVTFVLTYLVLLLPFETDKRALFYNSLITFCLQENIVLHYEELTEFLQNRNLKHFQVETIQQD